MRDSMTTFESKVYGAKSLDLASAGYEKLGSRLRREKGNQRWLLWLSPSKPIT
jgi:hypothetical protein